MTPVKTLHAALMKHAAEYVRTQHHVVVEPGVEIKDVLVPKFWMHHASRLRKFDLIDVIGQGFDITLRVHETGNGYANVVMIRKWESEEKAFQVSDEEAAEIEASIPEGYVVDHHWKTQHRVRMKDGGQEISRDHKTRVEAIAAAIKHHKKTLGEAA